MSTAQLPDAGMSQQEKHAPISAQTFMLQAEMSQQEKRPAPKKRPAPISLQSFMLQAEMSLQKKLTALLMRIKRYFAWDEEFNYNKKEK